MGKNPELSIIVVHFKNPGLLRLCLSSIKSTIGALEHEIIVVDSMTGREARDLIKEQFPEVKFLPFQKNIGYGRGVNEGIKIAKGDYLLILNHDIIFNPGAIAGMLKFLKNNKDIGILGPKVLNFNNSHQKTYFRYYTPLTIVLRRTFLGNLNIFKKVLGDFLMLETNPNKIQTPDWIMGSIMMLPRKVIEKVGLMDNRFFMYFEDVDWCRRVWHNGYKVVYYPKVSVYHSLGRGSKLSFGTFDPIFNQKTRWHIKSAIRFFIKYKKLGSAFVK